MIRYRGKADDLTNEWGYGYLLPCPEEGRYQILQPEERKESWCGAGVLVRAGTISGCLRTRLDTLASISYYNYYCSPLEQSVPARQAQINLDEWRKCVGIKKDT